MSRGRGRVEGIRRGQRGGCGERDLRGGGGGGADGEGRGEYWVTDGV